ncbi:MAG TPA: LuxR C-terminal-related transcriptional regulator [Gallionella sp.]|nr:LuxR C-terminal-related transcriptional regulator [Gallionella sp.]
MNFQNVELTRLSELIRLIYEGATAPGRWTKDILPAVTDYLQAPAGILHSPLHTPQDGGYSFLYGITQDHVDQYVQKYFDQDLWTIAMTERKIFSTGKVLIGDELVPRTKLLASDFYKECLARNENMVQLVTGCVFGTEITESIPTAYSIFRGSHHPDFTEENRSRMKLLLPHLSCSLGVMQRLRTAELTIATSLNTLDSLPSGILLINDKGQVAFANRSAKRMLEDNDGLSLRKLTHTPDFGELVAESASAREAISEAISSTLARGPYDTSHFSKCIAVPHTSGAGIYTLQLSALEGHNEFGAGNGVYSAIIFIADSTQAVKIDLAALQSAYGLTLAEARVAVALVEASSAKEVADQLGVSTNTVNTQIKQIYSKLCVDTRARFVKLMIGLAKSN